MKEVLKTDYKENKLVILLLFAGLFLPAFMQSLPSLGANKQLIIGTIVNGALFLSSVYMKDTKKIIAMSTLPSISSILSGLLFSGLTKYSAMMLPFIWLGNLSIIYLGRVFRKKLKYATSGALSILTKVIVIYGGFLIISRVFNFPDKIISVMNTAMGITQIYTGLCGMILSLIVLEIVEK